MAASLRRGCLDACGRADGAEERRKGQRCAERRRALEQFTPSEPGTGDALVGRDAVHASSPFRWLTTRPADPIVVSGARARSYDRHRSRSTDGSLTARRSFMLRPVRRTFVLVSAIGLFE